MKIYRLTQLGKRAARNVRSPDTSAWRCVHYLDRVGHATGEQLTEEGVTAGDMAKLRRRPAMVEVVGEDTGQRLD